MPKLTDTIVAPITGRGPAPVSVLRLSGPDAWEIAGRVFQPWMPIDRRAVYGRFKNGDDGLALPFEEGRSYTGEQAVELSCHGSRASMEGLLEACVRHGARLAGPGEFTQRAFLNGRMDLSQAEAVRDTIEAETLLQLEQANDQRRGALRNSVRQIAAEVTSLLVSVEAHVDFAEELGDLDSTTFLAKLDGIASDLCKLRDASKASRILRDGYRIAILGPPNAGKSSLLNALLGFQRAIVTPHPGTTRDTLEESLDFDGLKVVLTDTAGIRESNDPIEKIGIERARSAAEEADLTWLLYDCAEGWSPELAMIEQEILGPCLVIANKIDLPHRALSKGHVAVSCKTQEGLHDLVLQTRASGLAELEGNSLLPNPRQTALLEAALAELAEARSTLIAAHPSDLLAVCLGEALSALGGITGESVAPDILERIFSDFCIGK